MNYAARTIGNLSPWRWLHRPVAAAIVAFCFWSAWTFPFGHIALSAGLAIYLALLLRWPHAWLLVLPATLPVLELAFWSGRIFFNAYDLLLLTTIAWGLWRGRRWLVFMDRGALTFALILVVTQSMVTLNGLLPLDVPVPGAWTDYFSSTNALREFKGILGALLLWPMLAAARGEDADVQRWLAAGMLAGLTAAVATISWERGLFTGLFNFSHPYRVSGWFFSMHTGGAAIDAFLALSTPFVLSLFLLYRRTTLTVLGIVLATAALYALYVTYSRANYPALLAMTLVLAWGIGINIWRRDSTHTPGPRRPVWIAAGIAILAMMLLAIIGGQQIQSRFTTTPKDLQDRLNHWSGIVDMLRQYPAGDWFGRGKGAFPRDYYWQHQLNGQHLALAQLHHGPEQSFVRFSKSDAGGNLFLRQRFTRTPSDNYRLDLRLRPTEGHAEALLIEFCERHILKYRSECRWRKAKLSPGNGDWQEVSVSVDLKGLGENKFGPFTRPLDVSLMNRGIRQGLDIARVQLVDHKGNMLLSNPDFSEGWDHWFLSYGDHLRWHIKNVFVYWYYEGGLIGLMVMLGLIGYAAVRLLRAGGSGDYFALLTLMALTGVIMVGLFDSLFDDPRISLLILLLTGTGLISRPVAPLPLPSAPTWFTRQRLITVGRFIVLGLALILVLRMVAPSLFRPLENRIGVWAEERFPALARRLGEDYPAIASAELAKVFPPWQPLAGKPLAPREIRIGAQPFHTLTHAANALKPGDHLMIGPGIYKEPLVIKANDVEISGFGHVIIERTQAQGKAAIITKGDNIRLSNIECRYIAVADRNGACVRHEGRNLTLYHVYFHDAESGILTGSNPGKVHVIDSRLEKLGKLGHAHGIYMGRGGELLIEDSRILAAKSWGHEIKSRAPKTSIVRTVIASLGSNHSRLLDLPHGGILRIENSILEQGPASAEQSAIGFGLEGDLHPQQDIELIGNVIILEREGGGRLFRLSDTAPEPRLRRNVLIGAGTPAYGSDNVSVEDRKDTDIGPYPGLPPVPQR